VDRCTVTRTIGEVRSLLAQRGFAVPGQPSLRLRTLADVVACANACGVELRLDGTETQVRRPRAHRPGRRAFVSGKRKQNTIKPTVISDGQGRTLWSGAVRPGRMHDHTAVKTEGIWDLLQQHPRIKVRVDEGYRGLATAFPEQVTAPPRKPPKDAAAEVVDAYRQARTRQSSQRICVEHAIAEHKKWRTLQRYLGRREHFGETYLAVAGLISDGPLDADRASAGPVSPTRPAPYRAPSLRPSHRPGACWHTRASMTRQIPSSNA
jgi:DDE superfamily endonuclease